MTLRERGSCIRTAHVLWVTQWLHYILWKLVGLLFCSSCTYNHTFRCGELRRLEQQLTGIATWICFLAILRRACEKQDVLGLALQSDVDLANLGPFHTPF